MRERMRSRNVATPGLVCIMIDDNKLSCLLIYRGHDLLFLYLSTVCPKCYSEGKKCCVFHLSSFFTFFYFTNTHSLSTVSILILFLFFPTRSLFSLHLSHSHSFSHFLSFSVQPTKELSNPGKNLEPLGFPQWEKPTGKPSNNLLIYGFYWYKRLNFFCVP